MILKKLYAWLQCTEGATAIEYGLIAGGVSLAIVAAVLLTGDNLQLMFETIETILQDDVVGNSDFGSQGDL